MYQKISLLRFDVDLTPGTILMNSITYMIVVCWRNFSASRVDVNNQRRRWSAASATRGASREGSSPSLLQ